MGIQASVIPVRIHSACVTSEVFGSDRCDCSWQVGHALDVIKRRGCGMLIYLFQEGRGVGLVGKIKIFDLLDKGLTISEACRQLKTAKDNRDYTPAIAVLKSFGISKIELITNNPAKIRCAISSGLEVERVVSVMPTAANHMERYFEMKRKELDHIL